MALEFARFQATSHSRIMGQPRLQRVVMTGLAFEGEGPHKAAADYFARSPLSLTSTMADFKNYSEIVMFSLIYQKYDCLHCK